jgi:hypothetical protein
MTGRKKRKLREATQTLLDTYRDPELMAHLFPELSEFERWSKAIELTTQLVIWAAPVCGPLEMTVSNSLQRKFRDYVVSRAPEELRTIVKESFTEISA